MKTLNFFLTIFVSLCIVGLFSLLTKEGFEKDEERRYFYEKYSGRLHLIENIKVDNESDIFFLNTCDFYRDGSPTLCHFEKLKVQNEGQLKNNQFYSNKNHSNHIIMPKKYNISEKQFEKNSNDENLKFNKGNIIYNQLLGLHNKNHETESQDDFIKSVMPDSSYKLLNDGKSIKDFLRSTEIEKCDDYTVNQISETTMLLNNIITKSNDSYFCSKCISSSKKTNVYLFLENRRPMEFCSRIKDTDDRDRCLDDNKFLNFTNDVCEFHPIVENNQ